MYGSTGTPVPKREIEEMSRGSGPVITYKLTPEELEHYRATGKLIREEKHMSTLTKEQYLQLRLQGKGRTEIMKERYKSNTQAFYRQLQTWGIKEKDAEDRELELMAAVRKSGAESDTQPIAQPEDEPIPTPEAPSCLAKQLEQLILQHTQPKAESVASKIKRWAKERDLHTADPVKQALKLMEEVGELCRGMEKGNQALIIDSIGDMYVVLTVLSLQLGLDIEKCIEAAYEEIKDRKGKMINGVFVKEADLTA